MARQASGRVSDQQAAPAPTRERRAGFARAVPLLALAAGVALLLAGCGENQPYSHISPRSDKADEIQGLYKIIFWSALVVFVGVQAAIFYAALRFRRRGDERPEQIHGNTRLEIAWTVIPAVVLLIIFIPTAQTIYRFAAAEEKADFVVDVYGKQWWWEIHYPDIPGAKEGEPLVTANEVRLPVGANVIFNLRSNNVIHSFWVPQLSGKTDVIPGHDNKLQFTADRVGTYFGECAEFCGAAHAWMRFKVIVEPREQFDAWVRAWHEPPPVPDANPTTPDVVDVPPAFAVCLVCHRISGTNAELAPLGLETIPAPAGPGVIPQGPDLTLLACRDTIGAGILKNTPENLKKWLMNTDQVKEGVYMPNYYETGQLGENPDQAVADLVDYLSRLAPAGGCPEDPPVGGERTE